MFKPSTFFDNNKIFKTELPRTLNRELIAALDHFQERMFYMPDKVSKTALKNALKVTTLLVRDFEHEEIGAWRHWLLTLERYLELVIEGKAKMGLLPAEDT